MNKIKLLQNLLQKNEAALIESPKNRRYFTGMNTSNGMILATTDRAWFFTDFRYITAAKSKVDKTFEVLLFDGTHADTLKKHLPEGINKILFEGEFVNYAAANKFFSAVPDVNFEMSDDKINKIRAQKSEDELEYMRQAQKIADSAFIHILDYVKNNWKNGITEKQIAFELEVEMRKNGSGEMPFSIICASGANTALPHAVPSDKIVEDGDFITVDYGATVNDYCSDMTRTFAVGNISEKQKKIYELVLEAQIAAIKAAKAGVIGSEMHKIASDIFEREGLAEYFGHGLGHSLGIQVHEDPRFSPTCNEVIPENVVMSVEPGIYLPGEFGVRIEDCIVLKPDGCEDLASSAKNLIIL
ncbi:MAG: hypothetical protein DBX47_04210 [Clostridiales bacterium]|nr:MAG: hypothetical protein DBX47_04210 [Clostridiales bacterium]